MANVKNNAAAQETRRRLLEAAGEVFAQRGFHAATIKEITKRAGVNTAAVNYHFSDKAELYLAVIKHVHAQALEELSTDKSQDDPAQSLRQYVRAFIHHLLDPTHPSWAAQLFWREMAQPSPGLDILVDTVARPHTTYLRQIVAHILGRDLDHEQVILTSNSIASQCVFYCHNRAIIERLYPDVEALRDPEKLADHITRFSLAALGALPPKKPRRC